MAVIDHFLRGDRRALAKIITHIENRRKNYREVLARLYPRTGATYKIGFTGPPGAGKSSLVDAVADSFLKADEMVGIVAVDPSSPFTSGALLGDRIRMAKLSNRDDAFIRSMATRSHLGGLSKSAVDVIHLMDAAGKDVIIIETVGVGQDEVDIVRIAKTTVVVMVPGLGDSVQIAKVSYCNKFCFLTIINKKRRNPFI